MRNLLLLLLTVFLLYMLGIYLYRQYNRNKLGKRLRDLLKRMDVLYEQFVQERITYDILHNDSIEVEKEKLVEDCTKQLLPYIEALHYQVQQTLVEDLTIRAKSKYFSNVQLLIEGYYANTSHKRSNFRMPLSYERIENAFRKAIHTDVEERLVKLRTREY